MFFQKKKKKLINVIMKCKEMERSKKKKNQRSKGVCICKTNKKTFIKKNCLNHSRLEHYYDLSFDESDNN